MKYGRRDNEIAEKLRAAGDNFLKSKAWRDLRRRVIDTYGAECMRCKRTPKKKTAINVDHIKPRKTNPELALSFCNLQVLCGPCNKKKGNTTADYRGARAVDNSSARPRVSPHTPTSPH